MELVKTGDIIKMEKKFEGVLNAVFEHKIASTAAKMTYTGPYISPDDWYAVTSFFQWTYDTTHSESQVRWFLNTRARKWIPWAFPQEARTGMSAKEIDSEDKKKQRAALPDAHELTTFGTTHHHCSCSAFQSGTDEHGTGNNDGEKDQDGLHITVGNMDKGSYDLHARFYVSKFSFEPDMSMFWDIGDTLRAMVPPTLWDKIARFQMSQKITTPFPDQWKANLVEIKTESRYQGGLGYSTYDSRWGGNSGYGYTSDEKGRGVPEWQRVELAAEEAVDNIITRGFKEADIETVVNYLYQDKIVEELFDAATDYKVPMEMLVREMATSLDTYLGDPVVDDTLNFEGGAPKKESKRARKKRLKEEAAKAKQNGNGNGTGKWQVMSIIEQGMEKHVIEKNGLRYPGVKYHLRSLAEEKCDELNKVGITVIKDDDKIEFKPTHTIKGEDVMWNAVVQRYVNRAGQYWDGAKSVWTEKLENEKGNGIYLLEGKYCEYDNKLDCMVTVDGKYAYSEASKKWEPVSSAAVK